MADIDPMADFRDTPGPAFGQLQRLDKLAFAVCGSGGHIPAFKPDRPELACEFHRRLAWAYLRIVDEEVET